MTSSHALRRRQVVWFVVERIAGVICAALFAVVGGAQADDLIPPPWRGQTRTTVAEWDFITPSSGFPDGTLVPVVGDGGGVPNMAPTGGIVWDPVFNGSWIGNTGGALQFYIPNWIDNEPWKDLWVQITYQPNPTLPPPSISNVQAFHPSGAFAIQTLSVVDVPIDPLNNLWHRTEVYRLFPNPFWEPFDIFVGPDVVITQVVVDTWSVPEPSTFSLAGVGLALLGIRSWRRRRL
jgi:hypothetical protein